MFLSSIIGRVFFPVRFFKKKRIRRDLLIIKAEADLDLYIDRDLLVVLNEIKKWDFFPEEFGTSEAELLSVWSRRN